MATSSSLLLSSWPLTAVAIWAGPLSCPPVCKSERRVISHLLFVALWLKSALPSASGVRGPFLQIRSLGVRNDAPESALEISEVYMSSGGSAADVEMGDGSGRMTAANEVGVSGLVAGDVAPKLPGEAPRCPMCAKHSHTAQNSGPF